MFTRNGRHNAHINTGRLLRRIQTGLVSDDSVVTEDAERAYPIVPGPRRRWGVTGT